MLIGIPAILGPDLLFTLRSMGHGDEIALVDANYPAQEHARRLVRADGHGLMAILEAILTVMPLDRAVPNAILRAALNNDPAQSNAFHQDLDAACARLARACGLAWFSTSGRCSRAQRGLKRSVSKEDEVCVGKPRISLRFE